MNDKDWMPERKVQAQSTFGALLTETCKSQEGITFVKNTSTQHNSTEKRLRMDSMERPFFQLIRHELTLDVRRTNGSCYFSSKC